MREKIKRSRLMVLYRCYKAIRDYKNFVVISFTDLDADRKMKLSFHIEAHHHESTVFAIDRIREVAFHVYQKEVESDQFVEQMKKEMGC